MTSTKLSFHTIIHTFHTSHTSQHQVGELSFDEYQMILAALVEGGSQGVGGHLAGADVIDVELLKGEQVRNGGWGGM